MNNYLEPRLNDDGYEVVMLKNKKGEVEEHQVHVLVAKTFVPNPLNLLNVRHKDGNILNNRADNLEWY
jgi:hypothetical protein